MTRSSACIKCPGLAQGAWSISPSLEEKFLVEKPFLSRFPFLELPISVLSGDNINCLSQLHFHGLPNSVPTDRCSLVSITWSLQELATRVPCFSTHCQPLLVLARKIFLECRPEFIITLFWNFPLVSQDLRRNEAQLFNQVFKAFCDLHPHSLSSLIFPHFHPHPLSKLQTSP